jgi:hypothetical protein
MVRGYCLEPEASFRHSFRHGARQDQLASVLILHNLNRVIQKVGSHEITTMNVAEAI